MTWHLFGKVFNNIDIGEGHDEYFTTMWPCCINLTTHGEIQQRVVKSSTIVTLPPMAWICNTVIKLLTCPHYLAYIDL